MTRGLRGVGNFENPTPVPAIDILTLDDFIERFGVDPMELPDLHWHDDDDAARVAFFDGRLVSIRDAEGELHVNTGWRLVDILHRAIMPQQVFIVETGKFMSKA